MIFHSSLHKQRLWNLLKRFQFDEKLYLLIHTIIGIDCRESEHLGFLKNSFVLMLEWRNQNREIGNFYFLQEYYFQIGFFEKYRMTQTQLIKRSWVK